MLETITGAALVGSNDLPAGESYLVAYDPSTGEALEPKFRVASCADVDSACELAWAAFDDYRALPIARRADFLVAIAEELVVSQDEIIDRAARESGLSEARLKGEFARTCYQLNLFATFVRDGEWLDLRVDSAIHDRQPAPRPDLRMRQVPLGPVAVFGSSNFPLAFSVAGGDTVSALATGCPVVVKGHPAHLGTGELMARALRRAVRRTQMPEGVFSYLPGEIATGTALVENPYIKAVGFTGSRRGGLALAAVAAARREPIPVFAEMSSVNPVFLFPEALRKRAAEIARGYTASMTLGAGQFCTSPGLVFVLETADLSPFLDAVKTELGSHAPAAMLTPGIHAAFEQGRESLAASENVSAVARSLPPLGPNRGEAVVFETDLDRFLTDPRLSQEVFGAASLVVICKDVSELRRAAEHLEGQLTATLHLEAEDIPIAQALLPIFERKAGRILANSWPTGVEVSHAMVHGGPYPATSNASSTSVGTLAIRRFLRPVCYQDLPAELVPPELRLASLAGISHMLDGKRQLS